MARERVTRAAIGTWWIRKAGGEATGEAGGVDKMATEAARARVAAGLVEEEGVRHDR